MLLVASLWVLVRSERPAVAAAAEPRPVCPVELADHASAASMARACLGRVRIASKTTQTSEFFAEADGSVSAEVHSGVVRVRDGGNGWKDVDLNLERRPDGSVVSRVHPAGLVLAGAAGEGEHDLAVLGSGNEQIAVGWRGALPEPVLDGTKATYVDAKPGIDLVIETTRSGFETFLVVKEPYEIYLVDFVPDILFCKVFGIGPRWTL